MTVDLLDRLPLHHYRAAARLVLDDPTWGWLEAGAGDPAGDRGDAAAFARWRLAPQVLRDVSAVAVATTVAGRAVSMPIGVGPVGVQQALHPDAEPGMAAGVAKAGSFLVAAVNATTPIEATVEAAAGAPVWFQLYDWADRDLLAAMIDRAEAAGCAAIVPLVNAPIGVAHVAPAVGFRLPVGAAFAHFETSPALAAGDTFEYLGWLASRTSLPIIPKGIVRADDAARALNAGAAGIIVSTHGARQLPAARPALDALHEIAGVVGDRTELYLDGGVRTGTDVLIALALGARAVLVGRPACWGLAVGGARGVERVLTGLATALTEDAALCGVADVAAVPPDLVRADR